MNPRVPAADKTVRLNLLRQQAWQYKVKMVSLQLMLRKWFRSFARERLARGAAGLLEGWLQHQVLRRIAGEEEFGRQHKIRSEPGRFGARLSQPLGIAGDVADNAGNLGERDDEAVERRSHERKCARRARRRQSPPRSLARPQGDGRVRTLEAQGLDGGLGDFRRRSALVPRRPLELDDGTDAGLGARMSS